jgi:hypothetical protein
MPKSATNTALATVSTGISRGDVMMRRRHVYYNENWLGRSLIWVALMVALCAIWRAKLGLVFILAVLPVSPRAFVLTVALLVTVMIFRASK